MVGESHTGGRTARSVRSPTSKLSPSLTQRIRSSGNSNALVWRSLIAQVATSVAFVHRVITCSRLPVWSMSSCDKYTQRTSAGSTRPNTSSSHCRRLAMVPVSTITGSLAQDHHRVQVHGERRAECVLHLVDHPGVGSDPLGLHAGRRRYGCECHRRSPPSVHTCCMNADVQPTSFPKKPRSSRPTTRRRRGSSAAPAARPATRDHRRRVAGVGPA